MKKRFFQVCSFFLSIAILISMLPMSVFAEELQEAVTNAQTATESTETTEVLESSETYVVDELEEKRTEFSKEFLLSNGLHMAAVYADAVHYETDSGWEEIDNTLKTNADGTLSNTAGVWDVSFPQQLTEENSITIEKDGYTLSFSMAGELTASGAALMTAGLDEEVVPFSVTEVQASNAQVQEIDTTSMEETMEYPETVPDKVQSQVSYADVYENTDVVYDLNSNQVKESIILESYSEALQGYRYTLDVGTMNPVLEEDGQITFYDADRENVVLVMPAPYLVDDAGAYNDEIQVQLTGSGSSYTMLYILPQQWLAAEERAWPVVLDPAVTPAITTRNIQDQTLNKEYKKDYEWGYLQVGSSQTFGVSRAVVKFAQLPQLTSSDVIVSATMRMSIVPGEGTNGDSVIEVHKVTSDWESDSVYLLNDVKYNENIEDYDIVARHESINEIWYAYWLVTDIVRDWYANKNTGMLFKASDLGEALTGNEVEYKRFFSCNYSENNVVQPYLTITFRNNNGTESYWDYTPSSAGRAGTGYVNNFTGNLTWIRNDIGFDGNRMPVSISHVYNLNDVHEKESLDDGNNSNDSGGNSFGMGVGWRTNYNQLLYKWELEGSDEDYYVWEDEDGTDHYFELDNGKYKDEDGLELTLTTNGSDTEKYHIFDKYGNSKYFDTEGRLTKLENNQATPSTNIITYKSATSKLISTITDGAGRVYSFVYNSKGLLTDIKYQGNTGHAKFGYTGDKLTSVTDKDDKTSQYAYTDNLLTSVTDIDGYKLQYSYEKENGHESWQPYRVTTVKEYSGTTQGGELTFEYGHNQTVITDHNEKKKIIQFNDFGNPTCIQDGEGRAQFCEYAFNTDAEKNSNQEDTAKGNQLLATSDLQYTTSSLLLDGDMYMSTENMLKAWKTYNCTGAEISTESAYADTRVMKVDSWDMNEGECNGVRTKQFTIAPEETQTFSCFVKPKTASVFLMAKSNTRIVTSEIEPTANAWRRMQITYTNTSKYVQTIEYYILTEDIGMFYVDCVQLENAPIASRYNLINNGDFNAGTIYGWNQTNAGSKDGIAVLDSDSAAPNLDKTAYKMVGSVFANKSLEQTVHIIGKEGDSLMLSGWAKGNSAPLDSYDDRAREFALQCVINYTDGTKSDPFTARFNPDSNEWQYAATAVSAKQEYRSVTIKLVYAYNVNTVYFDGIQLNKDEGSNTFTYDKDGNVVSAVNAQGEKTSYEYDSNNLTSEILPTGVELTYEYDKHHNVKTATTQEGLVYTFTYDDYGNNTSVSISDGTKTMTSTATYKDEGNLLATTTDTLGNSTEYNYDSDTGVLHSVEPPKVTVGMKNGAEVKDSEPTAYTYDAMLRMTKATLENGDSEDDTLEVAYTYTNDLLTKITTKTTKYTFGYGDFGLRTSVSAGAHTLVTYNYEDEAANGEKEDKNFDLDSIAYGNEDVVKYTRDDQGRVTKETYEDGDRVEYRYDTSGALASVYDSESGITSNYCYDLTDRLQKYLETSNQDDKYSVFLLYSYDAHNRITRVRENINGYSRLSKYSYNKDNQIETFQKAYGYRYYNYDGFGRVTKTETKDHEDLLLTTTYVYKGPDNTATGQIESIRNTAAGTDAPYDVTYSYTYDERGNILTVSDGTYTTSYAYDFANQLIRENNQKARKTWTWTYDAGGNITSRNEYEYTIGELDESDESAKTVNYEYKDGEAAKDQGAAQTAESGTEESDTEEEPKVWGDLLTKYNGVEIKYDQIGNPEAIRGWAMEWQHGRELASMTGMGTLEVKVEAEEDTTTENGEGGTGETAQQEEDEESADEGTTTDGSAKTVIVEKEVTWSFTYNADGLRTKRVGVYVDPGKSEDPEAEKHTVTYSYVYDGGTLVRMTEQIGKDINRLFFSHSPEGLPLSVVYKGIEYYYVTNVQGDVVALLDIDGNVVVEYTYDAWGNIIDTQTPEGDTEAEAIANINPLRYRGYIYDEETGFYYLQSRYYDPEMGRFINADNYPSTGQGLLGNNMFAYCNNNPIIYKDTCGTALETVFDIISLATSVAEVIANPMDPWAWAGLVGDVIDVAVPFVTGVGEVTRAAKTTVRVISNVENVIDTAKALKNTAEAASDIKRATGTYVVLFESGKNYVGKGGFSRAITSATTHMKRNGDKVSSIIWAPTSSTRNAFISEYFLQSVRGVGEKIVDTFNKIWSPGRKLFK